MDFAGQDAAGGSLEIKAVEDLPHTGNVARLAG